MGFTAFNPSYLTCARQPVQAGASIIHRGMDNATLRQTKQSI